jgi:hypothetical protein
MLGLKERDLIDDLSIWRKRRVLKDPHRQAVNKKGQKRQSDLTGLVSSFELGSHGNVHVHCLYYGPFRRQEEMSAIWKTITGSFIVYVRPIENSEKAIREITKYVVKFSQFDEVRLVELHRLLEPYRRIRTYGAFLGMKGSQDIDSACWQCGEAGSLQIDEKDIPTAQWSVEYANWERHKSTYKVDSG